MQAQVLHSWRTGYALRGLPYLIAMKVNEGYGMNIANYGSQQADI